MSAQAVAVPLEEQPRRRGRYTLPDPDEPVVRRCLRHPGVVLELDPSTSVYQDTGLLCPVDGDKPRRWEVWDRVNGQRLSIADVNAGQLPIDEDQAADWIRWENEQREVRRLAQARVVGSGTEEE